MIKFMFYAGHNVSFSRSQENDLVEKLDGLVSIAQEWHKRKVLFSIKYAPCSINNFRRTYLSIMNGLMSRIRQLCLDQCKTLEADFIITRLIVPNMSFFILIKQLYRRLLEILIISMRHGIYWKYVLIQTWLP